jgi:hypothetical protein
LILTAISRTIFGDCTAEELGLVRGAVAQTVLSGHVSVIGAQQTGKTTWLANVLLLLTYINSNFIQPAAHPMWLSPHVDHRTAFKDRHFLTACLAQCCDGLWSFHWGGGVTKESKPYVTKEAFVAMISAVNRAPGEIICAVLYDFGDSFCVNEMKLLTTALISGRQFTAAWKFATRIFDAVAGDRNNAFIFTKTGNTLTYYAWLNTTTQFHCFKFAAAANMLIQCEDVFETSSQPVVGSPFDKVIGKGSNYLVSVCKMAV